MKLKGAYSPAGRSILSCPVHCPLWILLSHLICTHQFFVFMSFKHWCYRPVSFLLLFSFFHQIISIWSTGLIPEIHYCCHLQEFAESDCQTYSWTCWRLAFSHSNKASEVPGPLPEYPVTHTHQMCAVSHKCTWSLDLREGLEETGEEGPSTRFHLCDRGKAIIHAGCRPSIPVCLLLGHSCSCLWPFTHCSLNSIILLVPRMNFDGLHLTWSLGP